MSFKVTWFLPKLATPLWTNQDTPLRTSRLPPSSPDRQKPWVPKPRPAVYLRQGNQPEKVSPLEDLNIITTRKKTTSFQNGFHANPKKKITTNQPNHFFGARKVPPLPSKLHVDRILHQSLKPYQKPKGWTLGPRVWLGKDGWWMIRPGSRDRTVHQISKNESILVILVMHIVFHGLSDSVILHIW